MKTSFTLAEVLITLGIIGVVAALTMPALIANHRKTEIETRLRKVYSAVNQAVNMSIANDTWTMPPTDKRWDNAVLEEWLQTALFQYLNKTEHFKSGELKHPLSDLQERPGIILADGTILWFNNNNQIFVSVDINGLKGPNKAGVDYFNFFLDYEDSEHLGNFYPSGYAHAKNDEDDEDFGDIYVYGDREKMKRYCSDKKLLDRLSGTCALLIMHDGWEISKDYPIRL